jgi:prevent-host-death family protein
MPTFRSKLVQTIPATEANRRFSELLRGVREEGATFVVTSHGRAVAKVVPADTQDEAELKRLRREARDRLMEHLRAQPALNLGRHKREDGYD